jgi:hypothetical protein
MLGVEIYAQQPLVEISREPDPDDFYQSVSASS